MIQLSHTYHRIFVSPKQRYSTNKSRRLLKAIPHHVSSLNKYYLFRECVMEVDSPLGVGSIGSLKNMQDYNLTTVINQIISKNYSQQYSTW